MLKCFCSYSYKVSFTLQYFLLKKNIKSTAILLYERFNIYKPM